MTLSLSALRTQALLLDIEGTTTPIEFVHEVLFPFARAHAAAYVKREAGSAACRAALALLREEQAADHAGGLPTPALILDYVSWLMDRDRKSPGLKMLQGLIWQEGYHSGELRGRVYPDVLPAFERWRAGGRDLYIYSSGSVLAQELLFGSSDAGDLTALLKGYFDTAVGPKTAFESYIAIAARIRVEPPAILFVSDVVEELDAARRAGLQTALCVRAGGSAALYTSLHANVSSFDDIFD